MTEFWRDPALPFVESRRASDSRACYRPHSHPTLSIGAVDGGRSHFQCGDLQAPLAAGSLVTVPACLVHACNPLPALSWSYQMLHLDQAWVAAVLAETGPGFEVPGEAIVSRDPAGYRAFCQLNALLFSAAPAADKEAALIEFLGQRLWCSGLPLARVPEPAPDLESLKERLLANLDAPPSLPELAREYGISRYQLIRQFRRETGLTPHAWLLDQRVQQARRRLRQGAGLADLAQDLGFADQGHFQRVFKAHVAATPGRYRRN
ncbi:helix-turn-helix transcriptional regulator [Microbulbifer taiwanensis]|uniref:AraC family transcriptional regulator n=1 Tax=Microbulbifer taiwanensis TaxID=986746 RepID=A0ABW1YT35_9GAMM|nr:AraC family transcriptional regulator [Microbulbifer taiwanensis]